VERYQPDQYGRMMPDAHGQWVSLRSAEITALDAAQKASADAQATIAALQAQLTQLDRTLADVYAQRDGLQKDLAQRTAELEAIEKILDIDSGKTTVEKVRDLHHSFEQVWESYQDASNEMFKAQAELERVRGGACGDQGS